MVKKQGVRMGADRLKLMRKKKKEKRKENYTRDYDMICYSDDTMIIQ